MSQIALNQPAPNFSLTSFTDETFTLSEMQTRKNILLVFNRTFN